MSGGSEADPASVVRAMYAAFAAGDVDAALALMQDDVAFDFRGPAAIPYTGEYRGRDDVARFLRLVGEHVETLEFEVDEVIAAGERVVAIGHERMRVRATGREFRLEWADAFTIRDGRIAAFAEYVDTLPILRAFRPELEEALA